MVLICWLMMLSIFPCGYRPFAVYVFRSFAHFSSYLLFLGCNGMNKGMGIGTRDPGRVNSMSLLLSWRVSYLMQGWEKIENMEAGAKLLGHLRPLASTRDLI